MYVRGARVLHEHLWHLHGVQYSGIPVEHFWGDDGLGHN